MIMNAGYIAGFFDGEGSALIITIKTKLNTGSIYRFRPVIRIPQKTQEILELIEKYLGYGHVAIDGGIFCFVVNGLDGVLKFVSEISPYCHLKRAALNAVGSLAHFQQEGGKRYRNRPYTKEETIYMLNLRDQLFSLNSVTRSNLKQKYSRERILAETTFVDIEDWTKARIDTMRSKYSIPENLQEEIREIVKMGETYEATATALALNVRTVKKYCLAKGLTSKMSRLTVEENQNIKSLLTQGLTYRRIQEITGRSIGTISHLKR